MKQLLFFLCFILFFHISHSQTLALVADLNPGPSHALSNYQNEGITLNNTFILPANDGIHGIELYSIKNGKLELLKDICAGSVGSNPKGFVLFKGRVYFTAQDPAHGYEIWSTDGTALGTVLAIEAIPGKEPTYNQSFLIPAPNNKLYFSQAGILYVSDGTTTGTQSILLPAFVDFNELTNTNSPSVTTYGSGIAFYTMIKDSIFFYKHDGLQLSKLNKMKSHASSRVFGLSQVAGGLLFAIENGRELGFDGLFVLKSNTNELVQILNNQGMTLQIDQVLHFTAQKAIFMSYAGTTSTGIFVTDGTPSGTVKLTDGKFSTGKPIHHAIFQNQIFFYGDENFPLQKMYLSDGTPQGTTLVGTATSISIGKIIKSGNLAYWISGAINGGAADVYCTDVASKTSKLLYKFTEKSSTLDGTYLVCEQNSKVYVASTIRDLGYELFEISNDVAGLQKLNPSSLYNLKQLPSSNEYIISTENLNERLQISQYDINGKILKDQYIYTNDKFILEFASSMSILKVIGSKGLNAYKIVN